MGASGETGYFWSARELVMLPRAADADLHVISVDEDLLAAFRVDDGWLAVCETSVRRLVGNVETARVELGEVVDEELALRVEGERLIA